MKYRTLGRTGLQVSEVGFGAWAIGGNAHGNSYGPTDDATSLAAVRRARELGCNFFDSADVYGHGKSEELLGKALAGHRDEVILATKVGGDFYHRPPRQDFSGPYVRFAVQESLRRLGTDRIDVYQFHNPDYETIRRGEIFAVMDELRAAGKVRFCGVSIFDPREGIAAVDSGGVDTIQVAFNIFSPQPAQQLFGHAHDHGVGIIAREPLANGFLTGKYQPDARFKPGDIRSQWPPAAVAARCQAAQALRQVLAHDGRSLAQGALRYVLDRPEVGVAIPGAKTPVQVEENLAASAAAPLTADELSAIAHLFS